MWERLEEILKKKIISKDDKNELREIYQKSKGQEDQTDLRTTWILKTPVQRINELEKQLLKREGGDKKIVNLLIYTMMNDVRDLYATIKSYEKDNKKSASSKPTDYLNEPDEDKEE